MAGTWTAVSNAVSKRQAGRWAAEDQSQPQPDQPPRQASYRPPPPGRYQRAMFQPHRPPQPPTYQPPPPPQQLQPTQPTLSAQDVMSATLAQLQQLGSLKAQGVLTDAEFDEQKQKILGHADSSSTVDSEATSEAP
jgi:hypothetical protein